MTLQSAINLATERLNSALPTWQPGQSGGGLPMWSGTTGVGSALPGYTPNSGGALPSWGPGMNQGSGFQLPNIGSVLQSIKDGTFNLWNQVTNQQPQKPTPSYQGSVSLPTQPELGQLPRLTDKINHYAQQYGVPPLLFAASIGSETGGDPYARNPANPNVYGIFHANVSGGRGAAYANNPSALYDDDLQFQLAGPEFAQAWQQAQGLNLSDEDKLVYAVGAAQRYEDWQNLQGAGAQNVRRWVQRLLPYYQQQQGLPTPTPGRDGSKPSVGVSQNELQLSPDQAAAACGPAAALWFVQQTGRTPTVQEAISLAQQVGWNPAQGMSQGPTSEVELLNRLAGQQVARLQWGKDWQGVIQAIQQGQPVIIDTPNHYFQVTGYDPQSNRFMFGDAVGRKYQQGITPEEFAGLDNGAWGDFRSAIYMNQPQAEAFPGQQALRDLAGITNNIGLPTQIPTPWDFTTQLGISVPDWVEYIKQGAPLLDENGQPIQVRRN